MKLLMTSRSRILTPGILLGTIISAIIVLTASADPTNCTPPPSGLVGWWRGDGDCLDAAGTNNGTLQGGATFALGEVGGAFSFNPESGTMIVPDSSNLRMTSQLTIEAWINARTLNTYSGYGIVSKVGGVPADGTQNYGYQFGLTGNTLFGQFSSPGDSWWQWPSASVTSGGLIVPGVWYHVAWTYDQSAMKLYCNGQPVATNVIGPKAISATSSNLRLCGDDNGHVYFDGLIDEAAVYNRALSDSEIQAIYSAGSAGKCVTPIAPSIYRQPSSQVVTVGANVSFSVFANGTPPLAYQWQFNGTNMAGAVTSTLALTNVQDYDAGSYAVVVTNAYGTVTSSNAVLTVNPTPPCVPPPLGLVGWWRGEGNCLDQAGGNNGVLQNGASFASGEIGQAFTFDGVNDYVKIPRTPILDVGYQVTIDLWMKADLSSPIGSRIAGLVGSDFFGMEISTAPAGVFLFISTDNGEHFPTTADSSGQGAIFPAGEWHHVAGTYDGTNMQFYLDGQPYGNPRLVSGAISPMLSSSFVTLGSEDGRTSSPSCIGTRYFSGLIDEVDIFNRALSASEIAAIYAAGYPGSALCRQARHTFMCNRLTRRSPLAAA